MTTGMLTVGEKVKQLRKSLKLSQIELASGICHQSLISHIEKGRTIPTVYVLNQIAIKLGVDMTYFLNVLSTENEYYISAFKSLVQLEVRNRNYENLKKLLESEQNNPLFNSTELQLFIKWHMGICIYYLDSDPVISIKVLKDSLDESLNNKSVTMTHVEMLNSLGIIYAEINDIQSAITIFKEALNTIKKLPVLLDKSIQLKVYYNYAKVLTRNNQLRESLRICEKGINLAIKIRSLVCLGELYYQIGYNYSFMNKKANAYDFYKIAKGIFIAERNDLMVKCIREKLKEFEKSNR
ncbi:helix-turn-helix domain-containing protein [Halalkalibacter alkalisediminis]|uniref:Helix-turn-helix domain-containing protein n=2 Tax=Halalkalibacter alkalisediminis TaxID=935616 RepID=A0ABV6NCB3_9BACI|nr:helix-turn-helix domain-containing protein [Halalkalibacter alkalisediminis]